MTEVTFTNRSADPGTLKVCKIAGTGVVRGTPYRFTVGRTRCWSGPAPAACL